MRNKLFLSIICSYFILLNSNGVMSQTTQENIHSYYKFIYLSENEILNENLIKSDSLYSIAFKYSYPRSKDLYNAFLVSYYLNDSTKSLIYAKELVVNGFNSSNLCDSLINPKLCKILQFNLQQSIFKINKSCDTNFNKFCEDLFNDDQKGRTESGNSETQQLIDFRNFQQLKQFIISNEYPTFKTYGFCNKFANPLSICPIFEIILWHNRFTLDNEFIELLTQNLLNGKIQPNEFIKISIAHNPTSIIYGLKPWKIITMSESQKILINQKREMMLLDDLEDYYNKYQYHLKNKFDKFLFMDPILITNNEQIINSGFYGD